MDFTTVIWAVVVLGALAIVFGLILAVAAKVFEVEVDPRLPEIQACLAGANCGGCGYPGCGGCAEAILAGKAPINACAPAGRAPPRSLPSWAWRLPPAKRWWPTCCATAAPTP